MKCAFHFCAAFAFLCSLAAPALADPFLQVSANHFGDGQIVYTLEVTSDLDGNMALQITASGNIQQIPSVFAPDNPPDGGIDLFSEVSDLPPIFEVPSFPMDPDSWWDDTVFSTPNPPFASIVPDGAVGGFVGSTEFSYSAGTFGLGPGPNSARVGQIVIVDPRASGLPTGSMQVKTSGGAARLDIINPGDPITDSSVSVAGQTFPVTGSFFVIPEPSGFILLCIGLMTLATFARRRFPIVARR